MTKPMLCAAVAALAMPSALFAAAPAEVHPHLFGNFAERLGRCILPSGGKFQYTFPAHPLAILRLKAGEPAGR